MVNISPIAKGKLERICNTLLLNFFANPETPPPMFLELTGTFPVPPLMSSSSVSGGGDTSDKTIFLETPFPLFWISWELFSLHLMVNERAWALLVGIWVLNENGLNLKKGSKIGTLRKWVLGRHGFEEFKGLIDQELEAPGTRTVSGAVSFVPVRCEP